MHCFKRDIRRLTAFFVLCVILSINAFAAYTANYDTAWTLVYDGGKTTAGENIDDNFYDIEILPNGEAICVGGTRDSNSIGKVLLMKLSPSGKVVRKSLFLGTGESVMIARNGDYWVGGYRFSDPWLLRLDSMFNIKSSSWYYDSLQDKSILSRSAAINAMIETKDGGIVAVAGDNFPDNRGLALNNYAALLEYDSLGSVKTHKEWLNTTGYELAGWSLSPGESDGYMVGGKQAVFKLDDRGVLKQKSQYPFTVPGVGSQMNNISRVKQLRSGMVMVAGQSYEEDCWKRYQRLSFDAWWSPLDLAGNDAFRYTAGVSGVNDRIYDFTQLVNGNIVFVGRWGPEGGVWAIVTDSTGANILWEKHVGLAYRSAGGTLLTRYGVGAYSVAASPDSGFTVVGPYFLPDSTEGMNAFAAHFVPKSIPVSVLNPSKVNIRRIKRNHDWVLIFNAQQATDVELRLFTVEGQLAGRYSRYMTHAGQGEFRINSAQLKNGMYLLKLHAGRETSTGFFVVTD